MATLAVILGDWRRMPEFSKNAELLEEIGEMQTQLKRCKSIVSDAKRCGLRFATGANVVVSARW